MSTWAIAGAAFTPDDARAETFKKTGGGRGVTLPGDLKVTALPTPGPAVRIAKGGASLPNRYLGPDGGGQSYGTLRSAYEDFPIPATGSGAGATRYLIQRVTDPQYEGQAPANPVTHLYEKYALVPSIENLAYPFVELAKIVQPANTGTITAAMITDVRRLASPRQWPELRRRPIASSDPAYALILDNATPDGEAFPGTFVEQIAIPEWATHVQIRADWISIEYPAGTGWGECWVEFGPWLRENVHSYATSRFGWDAANNADPHRVNWVAVDEVPIPAAIRGTTQPFIFKGRVIDGRGTARATTRSGAALQATFVEKI